MAKNKEIIKVEQSVDIVNTNIETLIRVVRNQQVILDSDLAKLYGVETRVLNQAVQRNIDRFPEDFMFQLTKEEIDYLSRSHFVTLNAEDIASRSQNVILKTKRGQNIKYLPYVFTEQGIAMLSGVLRSPIAIATNIQIMRAFVAMRHLMASNMQMLQRLANIEYHQIEADKHIYETDKRIEEVFKRLDSGNAKQEKGILYDGQFFDAYTLIANLVKQANVRIILFDNFIDESVLNLLDKRNPDVTATIYTKHIDSHLQTDIARHDAQYPHIDVLTFNKSHDRFLCIDDTVYFIGASLKDLGKRWFAFGKMEQTTDELLSRM